MKRPSKKQGKDKVKNAQNKGPSLFLTYNKKANKKKKRKYKKLFQGLARGLL